MKKVRRIAFITIGGIGTGSFSQGVPILNAYVNEVSKDNDVVVFSLHTVHQGFEAEAYTLLSPPEGVTSMGKLYWLLSAFSQQHKSEKIEVIHAFWGYPSGVLSAIMKQIFGVPLIIHLQGGDAVYVPAVKYGVFGHKLKGLLTKWAYRMADELVALTKFQSSMLSRHFKEKTSVVIPFGIEKDKISPKNNHEAPCAPYHFLHIGHINPIKDQRMLLDAFREISQSVDGHLNILGEDTLGGSVHKYAREIGLGDSVTFVDGVPHEKISEYLSDSHILLHTSLYEAQAVVVSEALASGVPVCGTHVGLIADLAEVCTVSSPVGDTDALVRNVLELIHSPDQYADTVSKGLSWSREHSMHWTVTQFEQLYRKVCNQSQVT